MPEQINSAPSEIEYFRKMLALVQMGYYFSLFPQLHNFFGFDGWIKNSGTNFKNIIFSISSADQWRWSLLALMFALLIMMFKGRLNRFGLFIYYIVNLAFYHWNPYIIHEPQPILNLFFLSFFILPPNKKTPYEPNIKNILILFLGIYYFLSGIKKLPDPNFLNGTALESILTWPVMAKNLNFNTQLVKYMLWPIRLMNYLTLLFELTFIFFVYTRYRIFYILFGLFLHTMIYVMLDVGNLSFVMLVWYILLFDESLLKDLKTLVVFFPYQCIKNKVCN